MAPKKVKIDLLLFPVFERAFSIDIDSKLT